MSLKQNFRILRIFRIFRILRTLPIIKIGVRIIRKNSSI
jgi:hypothetical protein